MTVLFVPIPKGRIEAEWHRIGPMLETAIGHDEGATPEDVKGWLMSGRSEAFWVAVTFNATGLMVTTTGPVDGVEVCWLNYVAGTIKGGPRAFIETVRAVVSLVEDMARQQGCKELRGGGRNWARVFPDWERFDPDHPNRMRKVITHG